MAWKLKFKNQMCGYNQKFEFTKRWNQIEWNEFYDFIRSTVLESEYITEDEKFEEEIEHCSGQARSIWTVWRVWYVAAS